MRGGSPIAQFAVAVRARYARAPGRRRPLATLVRRASSPAAAVAVHRHLHVGVTVPWHAVYQRIERQLLAAPARAAVRSPVTAMRYVQRLLIRRERVERPVPRDVVRQAPRAAAPTAATAAPSATPPPAIVAVRAPMPAVASPVSPPALDVERFAADVIRAIDRRIIAQRERLGRV